MNDKENQSVEWKESWRDDYLRWICGFANGRGGVLVLGRSDDGNAVGIKSARKLLEELPNKIRDLLGIIPEVNLVEKNGKELVEIRVEPYSNPISYRGRYYLRSGSTLQELKGAALDRFLLQRQGRTWDSVPIPGVKVRDLSPSALRRFREMAKASGRLEPADLDAPDTGLVEKLKLTEGTYLRRAAALLFHPDPDNFITGAFVKIGFFRSESDLAYHDELHGDLFSQVRDTVDLVRTKYLKAAITYADIQRIELFPVPYAALREALLNALVHRDYAVTAPIQIRVYADKLKIWNPAVLPEGWDLEKFLGEHASHPFNPYIANAFFRAGEIEAWGRGIQRIFSACLQDGTPAPEVRLTGNDLWLEFPFSRAYLGAVKGESTTQETAQETTQEKILNLLAATPTLTRRQLAFQLSVTEDGIKYHLNKLKKQERIRHVGPTKKGYWEVLRKGGVK